MRVTTHPRPVPFTSEDYANRMARAAEDARDAALDGVIVIPGPDLVWLTGYQPTAITERLTMLVLAAGQRPTLLVPSLERADAETAEAAPSLDIVDWPDASDPYQVVCGLLGEEGTFGISDSAWALHLLAFQRTLPWTKYRALTPALPMLRSEGLQ